MNRRDVRSGVWLFSPGSVSIPKDGSHSFGIFDDKTFTPPHSAVSGTPARHENGLPTISKVGRPFIHDKARKPRMGRTQQYARETC